MKPPRPANDTRTAAERAQHDMEEALRVRAHFGRLRIERVVKELVTARLGPGWAR